MRTAFALASVASLASLAAAQTGFGRFPCTLVNGDGTFSANQALCADDALIAPGANDPTSTVQGDRANPTNAQCVVEEATGAYFCGIAGAACTEDANCDNGLCSGGICQGGFEQGCAGVDSNCSGFLYCLQSDFETTASNTCGAVGAFCQDYLAADSSLTAAQAQPIFNQFCQTGYCNSLSGNCDTLIAIGASGCADKDQESFACTAGSTCTNNVCVADPVASGRARARRNELHRRNLCPASHSACAVQGGSGFECIDTTSNLEQCGACASQGGVDCTQLPGVSSVGCVAGVCEIWSCETGFEWNAATGACESA